MITGEDIQKLIIPIITTPVSLTDLVARIANIFAILAGVIAFFYLIFVGILYITAGNSPDQSKRALAGLINVIIGIIIIALSYVIIRVVGNFAITIFK